ncbi:MAG: LysR substrate-binding domain-containing protein, partial [Inhella sp.]
MNLQQFRFVAEAARRNLNLTETAKALHTSQPGVSKAILELEGELGVDVFSRHGKRLRRITEPGQAVLKSIDIILREVANLKRIGEEYSRQDDGRFSIATTHTQARYVLPPALTKLRQQFPKLQLSLHQGNPRQVVQMLIEETAVVGLATESLEAFEELVSLRWYEWQHGVVMPRDHPLAEVEAINLT